MQKIQDTLKKQCSTFAGSIKNLWASKIFKIYLATLVVAVFALFFEEASIVLCAFIAVLACLLSVSDIFGIVLFFYPFFSIFVFKGINLYFVLYAVVIAVLAVRYFIEVLQKKQTIDWLFVGLVVAYLIYIILPIRKNTAGEITNGCDFTYFASALAFFVGLYIVYKQKEKINFLKCFHLFVIGFLIAGLLGWFVYISPRLKSAMTLMDYIGIDLIRYNGLFGVPNTLAIVGLMISAVLFYLQYKDKIGKIAYLYQTLVFALCYITLARSYLYAFFGGLALFVIATVIKEKKNSWKIVLPEIAGVVFVMLVLFMYTKEHFGRLSADDLVNGYNNSVDSDNLSQIDDPGRGGLIKIYLKDFLSSELVMLFGRGLGAPWIGGTRELSSHNTYLQAFWNTGIIGVILFIAIMLVIIKKYSALNWKMLIKSTFADFGNYILLLPILAMMFIENLFMNMQMIIAVMLVVFAISAVKLSVVVETPQNGTKNEQLEQNEQEKKI